MTPLIFLTQLQNYSSQLLSLAMICKIHKMDLDVAIRVMVSVWKSGSRNWKKTTTEPNRTAKNQTVSCSSGFSEMKNRLELHVTELG